MKNFELQKFSSCSVLGVVWVAYFIIIILFRASIVHSCPEHEHGGNSSHGNSSLEGGFIQDPDLLETYIQEMNSYLVKQMDKGSQTHWNDTGNPKENGTYAGPDLSIFRQVFIGAEDNIKRDALCSACQVYTGVLMHQINRQNQSRENLEIFAIFTCRFFKLAHPDVCEGVVHRLGPTFYWIVKKRKRDLSPQEFCGITFQSLGCRISRKRMQNSEFNWEVDPISNLVPLPAVGGGDNEKDVDVPDPTDNVESFTPLSTKRVSNQPIKILHLADLHIDPDYVVGTDADCENEVLCCQERFGYPDEEGEVGAGYYGDNRRCDAPMKMLHLSLAHIQKQHTDIDLIYMTGDLVPHNIWYTDKEENKEILQNVSKVLYEYFPNTRIIPCLGNHEAHPVNLYSPSSRSFAPETNPIPNDLRQDWVYETAYEAWKQWIPEDEKENFLKAGFFVVELNEKMRAIVVNTNVCYGFNMWQTYAPKDPGGMLEWLQNELYITKKHNKTAHIIGHVPPGHEDCSKTWSREFYKIVARYRNSITGQFYGHTHYDEFRILHDPDNKTIPISVMWIAPSLTPYRIFNPGYRIYHMDVNDTTYGNIVDHETWIFDIEKANDQYRELYGENGTITAKPEEDDMFVKWFMSYQATKAYNISDVMPVALRKFVSRMAKDKETFDLFYMNYYKATDPNFQEKDPCDTVCRKRILCGIVRSYYDDDEGHVECNEVQKEVDGIALPLRTLDLKKRHIWL